MKRPLDGMRVVDLSIWLYGPLAATLLADLGATVVKIERPKSGDFSRSLATLQGASMRCPDGRNAAWELFNRNKESLTLDLRASEGQGILRRLVADADAFVTNFQPSTLAQFNALPSQLLELNPRLVYGLGAGLGVRGRFADVPSQDTAAMAYAGFMFTSSPTEEPFYPPGGLGDVLAGTNLAFGIVSALLARERDGGRGRVVTASLLQALMWTQMLNIGVAANVGERLLGAPRDAPTCPLMNPYRCSDGWLTLGQPQLDDSTWSKTTGALDAPELVQDARFSTEPLRWENKRAIVAELDRRFARGNVADWMARLRAREVWCSPLNRAEDLEKDPDVVAEGLFARTDAGVKHVRAPFSIEGCEPPTRDAPGLGADVATVLARLGIEEGEIARLRTRGVV